MTDQTAAPGRKRILIVAHAFPPVNATAAHRPYSWARSWHDAGHEVHVLTPVKYPFDGAMDFVRDLDGIRVHEVAYLPLAPNRRTTGVPDARVARWERLKTITRRIRFGAGILGDLRVLSYRPMVRRGLQILGQKKVDFIIASSPPETTLAVARTLSRRTGVPWAADFRDLWFRDMLLYRLRLVSGLMGPINRWLVKTAAALVTVSRGLQQRLSDYLGRDVVLSYNGFFESDFKDAPANPSSNAQRLHVVYTGRLYPERRDPGPLFRALAALRGTVANLSDHIVVDFYGYDEPWLRALISEHRLEDCVTVHGFIPYRQSVSAQREADVLLFLDWTETNAEGVLTGKLFEYLASGRPILALGPRKDSEAARIIVDSGCGLALTSHDEILAWLTTLLESPRPPTVEFRNVERFTRERQALRLLEELTARLPATSERKG